VTRGRRVLRAVHRADDRAALGVEKVAGVPVQFGGHMRAAVDVGHHLAVDAQREGARRLAPQQHIESDALAALGQFVAAAEELRSGLRHAQ
jgi:hypothetical protein